MDNGGRRHRDGMEVNALGSLYKGPWEKKYWSSSRGKDRYPYPVGYQAVRWHGSHSYFMEICEDKRGPCFVVRCEEGIRCTGQTPTAAWEHILKKRHSGASKGLGRLSSSRINGSEMFGFTDPVVQLLLRDLMASDSGENSKTANASSSQQNDENRQNQGTSLSNICSVENLQESVSNENTSICEGVNQPKEPALKYGKESTLESVTADLVDGENEAVQENAYLGLKESEKKDFSQSNVHTSPMFKDWPPRKRMRTRRSKRNVTPGMFIDNPEYELLQTPRVPDLEKDKAGSVSAPEASSSSLKTRVIPKQDLQKAGQHIDIDALEKPESHNVNLHNSSSDFLFPQSPVCMCIKPAILSGDSLLNNDGEVDAATLLTHRNGSGPSSASHCRNLLLTADEGRLCENHQFLSPNPYSDAEMENSDAILTENFVNGMVNGLGVTTVLAPGHELDLSSETVEDQLGDQNSDEGGSAQQDSRLESAEQDFRLESAQQELKFTVSSSEDKTESDSIGQELAKSMMTLLLPKAIPLLQKGSRKWKRIRPLGDGITHNKEKLCNLFKPHCLGGTDIDIFKDREQENEFVPDSEDRNHGTQQMPELLQGAELYVASQSIHKPENSYAIDIATGGSAHGQVEEMEAVNNNVEDQEEIVNDSEGDDTPVYHKIDKGTPHAEHIEEGTIGSMHDEIKAQADIVMDNSEASDHEIVPSTGVEHTEELLANGELSYTNAYEPIVCFEHQLPVMSVQLNVQNQEIYACICCGYPQKKERLLFIYQVTVTNSLESKSLLVSAMDIFLREDPEREENGKVLQFQFEEYGIQFTPDARRLILLGCFLFPNARTSSAKSAESIMSSLQVVSFRSKEPLIETKLHSEAQLRCLLVSGPHMIIAAGDDGHIMVWMMDRTWRSYKEKFILPSANFKGVPFKSVTRLSAVPGFSHLIVGHNCFGSFATWDIQRRCIISSFQAEFHLKRACFVDASLVSRHAMYDGTNLSLKTQKVCATATTKEGKEDAGHFCLFLLVNVEPSELSERGEENSQPSERKDCWVTGAVENNSIAIGNSLDKRILVANLVGEYGVFGSEDGHVLVCEIESGKRLLELMELKGSAITHIAVEESALGIAGSDARVVLYNRATREKQM